MRSNWLRVGVWGAALAATVVAWPGVAAVRPAGDFWRESSDAGLVVPRRASQQSVQVLDERALVEWLDSRATRDGGALLWLPAADGSRVPFQVAPSVVMSPELAAKFPELRTWQGVAVDGSLATVRFETSPAGLSAMVFAGREVTLLDRIAPDGTYLAFRREAGGFAPFSCGVAAGDAPEGLAGAKDLATHFGLPAPSAGKASGTNLRTYRTAIAATGEYTATFGGTVAAGMRGIVSAINRVNQMYETELAIRLVLVPDNDRIVYTNGVGDPYTNGSGTAMLGENQTNLTNVIGSANYDFGHVFSTGGGGVASLGVVCNAGSKARGVTGRGSPDLDPFWVDYVAHEMGHQLNARHSFNGSTGSCAGGNRTASQAYEVGSGSTIMAYAGICGGEDLQPNSDPFFHVVSLDIIHNFTQTGGGSTCGTLAATGNAIPLVTATPNATIPARTPFALTATASDPDPDDVLTYSWEQFDLDPTASTTATVNQDNGLRPLFRSFDATRSPTRVFPRLQNILSGTQTIGEVLPTTNRSLNFRVTVRDNRLGGGGVQWSGTATPAVAQTTLTVVDTGAAFAVTGLDAATSWAAGSSQTVAWIVAGTTAAPISCANVAIDWSTDNGQSFPVVLAASTANDGSESITVPAQATTAGRVRVRCVSNIFFDINNAALTVTCGNEAPQLALPGGAVTYTTNGAPVVVDGGGTVTDADSADFSGGQLVATLSNNGGFDDRLDVRNQGNGAGQVGVSGATISFGGVAVGTRSGGVGVTPLAIALNAAATPAAVQAVVRNLVFSTTEDVTGTLPRTLSVQVSDGDGGTSTVVGKTINIALNLDPALAFIDDGDADNVVPLAPVTYTVAFTKDIDLATVGTSDFDNAGTATVTIGTITEPSPGQLLVPVTPTGAGTLRLRIPAGASILDATGLAVPAPLADNDLLTIDATLPTVTSIDDGDADDSVTPGTALTYTVVFSEDVDLSSVAAADFDNAGTAAVTLGTIAEPTPGTLTVQVTPTSGGTLVLRIPSGASVRDVAGNLLVAPVQDDTTVNVTAEVLFANSFEP